MPWLGWGGCGRVVLGLAVRAVAVGSPREGNSEQGKKLQRFQTALCSSSSRRPGTRGFQGIPLRRAGAEHSGGCKGPLGSACPGHGLICGQRRLCGGVRRGGLSARAAGPCSAGVRSSRNPWEEAARLAGCPLLSPQGPQLFPPFQGADRGAERELSPGMMPAEATRWPVKPAGE